MNINNRIKDLRLNLNMNQSEFAKRIGVTQPSLSDIENGKTQNISNRSIKLICSEFNVNEEWLRHGTGEMFKQEDDLLGILGDEIDSLDELDKKIITEYLKLSPKQRKVMKDFFRKLFF